MDAPIHKSELPPLECPDCILPNYLRVRVAFAYIASIPLSYVKIIRHKISLTTHQEILKTPLPFRHTHSPISTLIYDLGDIGKLRRVFTEHLYMLALDGLEDLHVVCIFPVRITLGLNSAELLTISRVH